MLIIIKIDIISS